MMSAHAGSNRRHGRNIYVATAGGGGSNSNSGLTTALPKLTLAGANAIAAAGDNIVIRGGTYNISGNLHLAVDGTAAKRITYIGYAGETAIIAGQGSSAGSNYLLFDGDYTSVVNLQIQNFFNAPSFQGGLNPLINGCFVQHIWDNGIIFQSGAVNAIAINNHTFSTSETNSGGGGSFGQGITFVETDGGTANNNFVERSYGEGIGFIQCIGGTCKNNIVGDAWSVCYYNDSSQGVVWDGNFAYATGNTGSGGAPAEAFAASQERTSRGIEMDGCVWTNNISVNCRHAFYYFISIAAHAPRNCRIANNTFVNSTVANFSWQVDTGDSGNIFRNNILYMSSAGTNQNGDASSFSFDHNSWFNGTSGTWAGTGDVTTNPNLVAPATLTAAAQKPTGGSPVLAAGTATSAPTTDIGGAARSNPPSIGAWETV